MHITAITCLPALAVADGEIACGDMRIATLPFERWLMLEGQGNSAAYDRLERAYDRQPPFFLFQPIEVDEALMAERGPEQTRALLDSARVGIDALVKAIHLYCGIAPIDPLRSVSYFEPCEPDGIADPVAAEHGVPRAYGESDKEYVLRNPHPVIMLGAADAAALGRMLGFVRSTAPLWSQGDQALAWQSLALSSAPGIGWPTRVLMLVGAIEALVVADLKEGLQAAFTRRVALLSAGNASEAEALGPWVRLAYQIRSDVVHGRPLDPALARLPTDPDSYLTVLGRIVVTTTCRLLALRLTRGSEPPAGLGAFLDAADPDQIDLLLGPAQTRPTHQWLEEA